MQQPPAQPIYLNHPKGKVENDDFYVEQYFVQCLAEFSYYIESNKEAMIIDPLRDTEPYLQLLEQRGATLKYVAETHLHADFVSSHLELSQKTGAIIVFGPTAQTSFQAKVCTDSELLPLGKIHIRVDHTPGHTLESSSYVLITNENKEFCAFTGDTLFIGEVGRPDLACKGDITKEDLAGLLFDSLRSKILKLPDDCIVYPGHGAGSACGKSIGTGSSCTIGTQKKNNYALAESLSKEEFILKVTTNIPKPPQYFFHDAAMNKQGAAPMSEILAQSSKSLSYVELIESLQKGARLIDSRENIEEGVIDGALNVSFSAQFASWVGTLLKPTDQIIILSEQGNEKLSIVRLIRIGYHNIIGYLEGGFETYVKNGGKFGKVTVVTPKDFADTRGQPGNKLIFQLTEDDHIFLDVRKPHEWQEGVWPGAMLIELSELEAQINKIPKDKVIHVYCAAGLRARMGMHIVRNANVREVVITNVGIKVVSEQSGISLVKP